jgi:hypothetical protein
VYTFALAINNNIDGLFARKKMRTGIKQLCVTGVIAERFQHHLVVTVCRQHTGCND